MSSPADRLRRRPAVDVITSFALLWADSNSRSGSDIVGAKALA